MQETKQGQVMEIDLLKLLGAYLRKWWLIVLCGVVVALGSMLYTSQFVTPMYRAGVTIYVNNSSSGERIESITSGQMNASQQLVRTYVNIIGSDKVLEAVILAARLDCTAADLRKMMTTEQMSDTEMFKVYIKHPEPEKAAFIANAIADVAPGAIENIIEGSSTKIIDYARVPEKKFSPSIRRNTLLGGVIGAAIAVIYLTVAFLADVRIKEEEDLTSISKYPVLGQIPEFSQLGSHSGRYGYRYGYGRQSDKNGNKKTGKQAEGGKK